MRRRCATVGFIALTCLAIYFGKERFLGAHLGSMFLNELVPQDKANDTTRPATMDPLQMVYLTWAAGDALRHGHLLVEDRHQFASRTDRFRPMVLDALVYLGGLLSLVAPLALAYNLGQVVLPLLILALGFYRLLRVLAIDRAVAIGFAVLVPFMPYRLLNSAMGQHNAASVCLVPLFYLCATEVVLRAAARRWFALSALMLLVLGCSEEHLGVAAIVFAWPFLVGHALAFASREPSLPRGRRLLAWMMTLARQGWPALVPLAALAAVALYERHNLLDQSLVRHVYSYDVVQMYSIEFNENYFNRTVRYHFVLLPVALAGVGVVIAQLRRRVADDPLPIARLVFLVIFAISLPLSLGHVPLLDRVIGFDPYRLLFDHVPLFKMQRYPHRMLYTTYVSGLVMAACAVDATLHRLAATEARRMVLRSLAVVLLVIGAIDWVRKAPPTAFYDLSSDADAALHQKIRVVAGREQIILRLPALSGSMWSDTRTMLTAMRTGARFFNGYWAYMPGVYRELQPSLQRLGETGQLVPAVEARLRDQGVRWLLVDKAYVGASAVARLTLDSSLEVAYDDVHWRFFRLRDN